MGCDIHCFAEVKRNNKWKKVGDPENVRIVSWFDS